MTEQSFPLRPLGRVESELRNRKDAPRHGDDGTPVAWLVFDPSVAEALQGVAEGTEILVLTWLHQGRRDVLSVHRHNDPGEPEVGVFASRSPDRPNPIGLHRVRVLEVDGLRLRVGGIEAIDGTPVVDVKSVRDPSREG